MRTLLALAILCLPLAAQPRAGWQTKPPLGAQVNWGHPLTRGLVGWWLFNEGAGARLGDIAGGNHGTLTNMDPASDWVGSPNGGALDFDGVDDYTNNASPSRALYLGTGDFSVVLRARNEDTGNSEPFIQFTTAGGSPGWYLNSVASPSRLDFVDRNFTTVLGNGGDWTISIWHFVFVKRQSGTVSIQIDNKKITSGSAAGDMDNATRLRFAEAWKGVLDDLRIYNRALSADEAMQLYTNPYAALLAPSISRWFVAPPAGGRRRVMVADDGGQGQ